MTDFLTVEDVLILHSNQIELYGGDAGVRDMGLMESAVAQPMASFDGKPLCRFPFEMAAAYLFHLVQNHPFVDGNKRTGAVAALVFLDINGFDVEAPVGSIYDLTIGVATGTTDKSSIVEFFQKNTIRRADS